VLQQTNTPLFFWYGSLIFAAFSLLKKNNFAGYTVLPAAYSMVQPPFLPPPLVQAAPHNLAFAFYPFQMFSPFFWHLPFSLSKSSFKAPTS
jgi:hypothetical protein